MSRTICKLAALVLVVLIIAGCSNAPADTNDGSSSDNNTAPTVETGAGSSTNNDNNAAAPAETESSTATPREQAIQFAECMRKNGISEFPDPDASGSLTIEQVVNGAALDTDSAMFQQALGTCKDLQPAGFTGGIRSPEQQAYALKFAQCMRDNGVSDFPDPTLDSPLVDTNRIPSTGTSGGMSILQAAMNKCGDFAVGAGVTGGR